MIGSVLVIGAGVAGINAALDLTAQGYKVILLETKPTIGGRMAQLDKMFPSDECGMCTILPKLLEVTSNPNIQLMAFCEIVKVQGEAGDFTVKVLKKPRYVDPMKCNACTECFPACPVGGVPIEFNYGRGTSKAIAFYSPFPPRKALIYPEACDFIKNGKCGDGETPPCVEACQPGAIDFTQVPTEMEIHVGAIVMTTGLDVYIPEKFGKYGYGSYENVVSSIEFERLLSGIGPTAGEVKRLDGTVPDKIAWIQCVGPKDLKRGATYCSAVCCMAATTEALGTLDRNKEGEVYIIHDDIVGYAKGFQEHYRHAEESGVTYIRSRVEEVVERDNSDLFLKLRDPSGNIQELLVGMLVLSTNLIPHKDNPRMAEILGVDLDEQGFFQENDPVYNPLSTTRDGVFMAGTVQGPKDISESIVQACGASAKASCLLADVRGNEVVKPPEKKLKEVKPTDEPRIGVMLCDCGKNIAGFIDMEELENYAGSLPNVEVVNRDLFACGGAMYKDMITSNDINRTVMVACSPKTHEYLFGLHTENAGLNKHLMEMVNVRNHCSWVHTINKKKATDKAKKLVKMGVARARLIESLTPLQSSITQSCLVIGGGVAGMTCANRIAEMGFIVHLVDKNRSLGGKLNKINSSFMTDNAPTSFIAELSERIMLNKRILIHLDAQIKGIQGFIGQFEIDIQKGNQDETLNVGSIVVATGAQEMIPVDRFSYGKHWNIITQMELEECLKEDILDLKDNAKVVMISCVGAKEKGDENIKTYCCNIGCGTMLKNAEAITTSKSDATVYLLHRDWTLPQKNAERKRMELMQKENIEFIRYTKETPPHLSEELEVSVIDADTNEEIHIHADLIVLTSPLEAPEETTQLKEMLGVCQDPNNFLMGVLGKLRPLDFTADGIFLCGTAHSPKGISEVIADGEGAASRVATIISKEILEKEPITSFVVDENCDGCAYCIEPCVFNALTLLEYMKNGEIKKTVEANETLCKGCGVCMATCPKQGIYVRHFKPGYFSAMIGAALEVEP